MFTRLLIISLIETRSFWKKVLTLMMLYTQGALLYISVSLIHTSTWERNRINQCTVKMNNEQRTTELTISRPRFVTNTVLLYCCAVELLYYVLCHVNHKWCFQICWVVSQFRGSVTCNPFAAQGFRGAAAQEMNVHYGLSLSQFWPSLIPGT